VLFGVLELTVSLMRREGNRLLDQNSGGVPFGYARKKIWVEQGLAPHVANHRAELPLLEP
jgi:hypothetical protein